MKQQRRPNFEVLRVLAILGIVVQHFCGHGLNGFLGRYRVGEYAVDEAGDCLAWLFTQSAYFLGQAGVNIFVLITGYFLCRRLTWRWRGMLGVSAATIFYTTIIYAVALTCGTAPLEWKDCLDCLMPIPMEHHWFIRTYLALLIIAPLLARAVSGLSRRTFTIILVALIVLHSCYIWGKTFSEGGRDLPWFVVLFLTGAYLRNYMPQAILRHSAALLAAVLVLSLGTSALAGLIKGRDLILYSPGNNTTVYLEAVLIFLLFVKWKAGGRWAARLARLSPYVLGVYLIHDDIWVRNFLWGRLLPLTAAYGHWQALATMIVMCPAVFALCAGIDCLRTRLFRSTGLSAALDRLALRLETRLNISLPKQR